MSSDGERTVRRFDWDVTPPSVAVVHTLSEVTDRDERDLDLLVDSIDPDALDDLVGASETPLHVEFEYEGHTITVLDDGRVTVTPV